MDGKRFLHSLKLRNFLSFGSEGVELELEPLNVLIGPNNSGKSNLLEAVNALRHAPTDISEAFRQSGGVRDYLWKGDNVHAASLSTQIGTRLPELILQYDLEFSVETDRFRIEAEHLADERYFSESGQSPESGVFFGYGNRANYAALNVRRADGERTLIADFEYNHRQSILSQRQDPVAYPEITYLHDRLPDCRFFRDWNFGPSSRVRQPAQADARNAFLSADGSNLSLIVNTFLNMRDTKKRLFDTLQVLCPDVVDVTTETFGGYVRLFIHERGLNEPISAARMSDGMLKYLSLLAILLHPDSPPLVCIEEPEIGLHPDAISSVAELLIEASQRTQLIVTTHSDILVSALSDVPEAVVVCERDENGTSMKRLDPERMKKWLVEEYLGELWMSGELGGTRW